MKQILEQIYAGQTLSEPQARQLMIDITQERFNSFQVAALLSAFRMRMPAASELAGFRNALLDLALDIPEIQSFSSQCVDVCGTGGDLKDSFNISTCVSFVLAAMGIKVVKHGNYGLSSKCGSSNVIEALGISLPKDAIAAAKLFKLASITFLHAPFFHPAMKSVATIRKDLAVRTVFNILGPLVNPVRPKFQLIGVYSVELLKLYTEVLRDSSFNKEDLNFCIVHSLSGYDEVSLTGDVLISTKNGIQTLTAADFGLPVLKEQDLKGADTIAGAAILLESILAGAGTQAQNMVVAANAGLLLSQVDSSINLKDAVQLVISTLASGKALALLNKMKGDLNVNS